MSMLVKSNSHFYICIWLIFDGLCRKSSGALFHLYFTSSFCFVTIQWEQDAPYIFTGQDHPIVITAVRYIKSKKKMGRWVGREPDEAYRGEHREICRCDHSVGEEKKGLGLCPSQQLLWPQASLQQRSSARHNCHRSEVLKQ